MNGEKILVLLLFGFVIASKKLLDESVDDKNRNAYFLRGTYNCTDYLACEQMLIAEAMNHNGEFPVPIVPYRMTGNEWLEGIKLVEERLEQLFVLVEYDYMDREDNYDDTCSWRQRIYIWRLKSQSRNATKQMWFVDHPRSNGVELILYAKEFCESLGDDWDCLIPAHRLTYCWPPAYCEVLRDMWLECPERQTITNTAYDLKHIMHMLASHYNETFFYVLSEGISLLNEFLQVAPGRSFAVTSYPGSTCPYDGMTFINTSVIDTLQKLSTEKPILDEDSACSIFMFGESDMKDMRDEVTGLELLKIMRHKPANYTP